MWITTRAVYDLETGRCIVREGYEYDGFVALACSDSGTVVANDNALSASGVALNKAMTADATASFNNQSGILAQQAAKFSYMASNPLGYTPQELATQTTSINQNAAQSAKTAIGAASAFAAAHGGADFSGGGAGAMVGQIASQATNAKAGALADLSMQNKALTRSNMLTGLQGLNQVGAEYGGATGTTLGGANSASGEATNAGTGAISAANTAFEDIGSVIQGVGGVASAFACVTGETLIIRANGIECRADAVIVGDELFGLSGKETVLDVEKTANVPCVHITTRDGITITVSCSHTFACPSGGYITASDCLGKILKSERGTSLVTNVHDAGALDVLRFKLDNRHGYITNGLWSLE